MRVEHFSYQVFFERVFDPIALYRVEGESREVLSADKIFFVDVNPAYERVMKVTKQDIVGRNFLDVWPEAEACWSRLIVDCLRLGHTVHCESESRDAGRYLEAIAFPLPPRRAAVIFMDKTEWKTSNDALKRKQEELRALAAKLTLSEEITRRTIASDLHDRIGYELVAQLKMLRDLMGRELSPDVRGELRLLTLTTERLISQSRSLIFELSPPVLKEVGLNPALEALAKSLLEPQGIRWGLRSRGTIGEFNADDAICVLLYRMTRELLLNVIKHSGASRVTLIINRGSGGIMVAVEDDGRGFDAGFSLEDAALARAAKGFGLFSIRERLQAIGGRVRIVSEPGRGATVAMSCPLKLRDEGF
ncbi:MAG: histidine kinase [Fretibacterium sp.]|nr:histidine kinase [Fretibacterium sp.]